MTTTEDLLWLENSELILLMSQLADRANREYAHQLADEILVVALIRAVTNEITGVEVGELISSYREVERSYG